MIPMHVGNKDPANLAGLKLTPQELMLSTLTTIKQPNFGSLWQSKGNTGDVPRSRRNSRTCSQKCNVQSRLLPTSSIFPILTCLLPMRNERNSGLPTQKQLYRISDRQAKTLVGATAINCNFHPTMATHQGDGLPNSNISIGAA